MLIKDLAVERRKKFRFSMNRDLRYKVLEGNTIVGFGMGTTLDMGSGGVAFLIEHQLPVGSFIELSISWPVLLEDSCPMRLIVFGRVVRSSAATRPAPWTSTNTGRRRAWSARWPRCATIPCCNAGPTISAKRA